MGGGGSASGTFRTFQRKSSTRQGLYQCLSFGSSPAMKLALVGPPLSAALGPLGGRPSRVPDRLPA
jgi:hypothetical protein